MKKLFFLLSLSLFLAGCNEQQASNQNPIGNHFSNVMSGYQGMFSNPNYRAQPTGYDRYQQESRDYQERSEKMWQEQRLNRMEQDIKQINQSQGYPIWRPYGR